MRRTTQKLLALGTAATLGLAACGGDDETTPAVSGQAVAATAPAESAEGGADDAATEAELELENATTDDAASTLRAELTSLLQEHVYLAGVAIETALDTGGVDDPAAAAAVDALDQNSAALGDAIASVSSPEDGEAFLEAWREHVGFFVDYTLGRVEEDRDAVNQALADLEGYQETTADFLEELTDGEMLADETFGALEMHVTTLTEAIDAMVADDPEAFALLREAADHMDVLATDLATGIGASQSEELSGDVASVPAETRATLTSALQAHAYLAGIAIEQAVEAGGAVEDPAVQAAVTTLDDNSVDIANAVGSVAGNDERAEFLDLWRQHIDSFVAYAVGLAGGDQAAAEAARTDLDAYRLAAGDFFERITDGAIPAGDVVADLDLHVATMLGTIDAIAAGDPTTFAQLREAGQHMRTTAAALATAIVQAGEAEDAAEPADETTETGT